MSSVSSSDLSEEAALLDTYDLVSLLQGRAELQPNDTAYVFLDEGERARIRLSFSDLDRRARAIAARLQESGLAGERALLLYPPGLDYIQAFFGCLYAGVVAVPAYPPSGRHLQRLQAIFRDASPASVMTVTELRDRFKSEAESSLGQGGVSWLATDEIGAHEADGWTPFAVEPDSLAFLQYTSGSTGNPRGVMISHANLLVNQALIKRSFQHSKHSTLVGWLPLYHDMGLIGNVLQPLYVGSTAYLMSPLAFLEKPFRWLQAISNYRAHTSGGPNFAYDLCARKITAEQKRDLDLSSWTVAFSGAEPVRATTLDRFAAAFAECGFRRQNFFPCYGLAEATLVVTAPTRGRSPAFRRADRAALGANQIVEANSGAALALVGCGHTWPGHEVRIVNPETEVPCADGEIGEIWAAGASMAKGYWNQPEESARTFQARLAGEEIGRFLRTGDLGFSDQGELFVTGRLKDLIIIAGRNYYPHDFERVLDEHVEALRPGSNAAFSVTVEDQEALVIVAEPQRSTLQQLRDKGPQDLFQQIRESLASECDVAPADIVLVQPGSIPKTSSGKIRRASCRQDYLGGRLQIVARSGEGGSSPALTDENRGPSGAEKGNPLLREALALLSTEQRIGLITRFLISNTARLLRIPEANLADNTRIMTTGLDSLRTLELKHALDVLLGVEIPLSALLADMTFEQIASVLNATANSKGERPAPRDSEQIEIHDLSYAQRAMWTVHQLEPASISYNLHLALDIEGPLDGARLQLALARLVEHHEQLRALYRAASDSAAQTIAPLEDLPKWFTQIAAEDWDMARLQADLAIRAAQPFDLEKEAPFRTVFYRRGPNRSTLFLGAHHIALDLWSILLLLKQLGAGYRAREASPLPELPRGPGYADFIKRQDQYLAGAGAKRDWDYWRAQLVAELPVLELETDFARPAVAGYKGASERLGLDNALVAQLKSLASQKGVSLFTLLLAAYFTLLYRYTGQRNIIVGVPTSGRLQAEFAGLIGNCVNPIALRGSQNPTESFSLFLSRIHEQVMRGLDHQKFPFPLIIDRLQPERHGNQWPIYQTLFVLQQAQLDIPDDLASLALGEDGEPFSLCGCTAKPLGLRERVENFDLKLMAATVGQEILLSFQYRTELFASTTISRMAQHYRALLEGIVAAPETHIGDLAMLSVTERQQMLAAWNANTTDHPDARCLHDSFEDQVARTPNGVAVVFEDAQLTYAELNARANQLAHHLRDLGVGPETIVGICAERSLEMVIGLLGILKAGGAYLPLDPDYPSERLAYMIEDTQPLLVLTQAHLSGHLPATIKTLCLDKDWLSLDATRQRNPQTRAIPQNLAYVIYTSGSTGRPKGVAITHGGVVNRLEWMQARYGLSGADAVLQKTPFGFDVSVWEFFWPLRVGARLIVAPPNDHREPERVSEIIERERVTTLHFVPSMLRAFLSASEPHALGTVRRVLCSGEELSPGLVEQFYSTQSAELHNLYGPTEASIDVAAHTCEPGKTEARIPIGRPIWNTRLYILDTSLNPVPIGVAGQLYIGGVGLARGYLGQPDLTAERFVPNPFDTGERLYASGDLARYRPDGNIEFLGRIDHQVKIRGFRIELGEIEAALCRVPDVRDAVVLARADSLEEKQLVAYVVANAGSAPTMANLRASLQRELPDYMVPFAFVILDALPLTSSGKLDRKALPAPDILAQLAHQYMAPRTPAEDALCRIWAEVLGLERIGVEDNFFDLGGDSIRAIRVASRMQTAGFDLSPRQLLQFPTVGILAANLKAFAPETIPAKTGADPSAFESPFSLAELTPDEIETIKGRVPDIEDLYPLTPMQEGMLFHSLSQPKTGIYHMQERYEIKGAIDLGAFADAWQRVVDGHSILRTSFLWDTHGCAHQLVHRRVELPFAHVDLRHLSDAERRAQVQSLLKTELEQDFDLSVAPLLRIQLIRLDKERYLCVRSFHHIIMDDWCTSPLLLDFRNHYAALSKGSSLPCRANGQFRDYLAWIRQQDLAAAEKFWRRYLDGFTEPTPLIGGSDIIPSDASGAVDDVILDLTASDSQKLGELARKHHLTVNTFVQAALALLLCRYAGTEEVVFGVTVAGRPANLASADSTIGLFINSLPLRVRIRSEQLVRAWLKDLLADNLDMRQYEFVSQSMIQRWSAIPRADSLLFQHLLTFENAPIDPSLRAEKDVLDIDLVGLRVHTNYPITFVAIPADVLTLRLTYARDRFEAGTMERMARHLKAAIEGLIRGFDGIVGTVEMLDPSERIELLEDWNRTGHVYGEPRDLIGRFEAQVLESPEAVASSCGSVTLSYQALNEKANRLAHALIGEGVGPDTVVALLDERGLDFLAMMLAIFKAGAAYLPLDPAHPDGRIAQVLVESQVGLLLAGTSCRDRAGTIVAAMADLKPRLLDLATLEARESCRENPRRRHGPKNLAFVIYTSGSTGKPKGAMVEHQGMFNNLITKVPALELTSADVIAQTASQCFDISVWQFLTALTLGARVEIFPDAISRDPQRLLEEIAARGVTILEAVPSMIRALLDAPEAEAGLAGLRWLLPCGEAFAPELCRRFMERHPRVRLLNAYGPAECSDDVSYYPIEAAPAGNDLSVPIGRPVDNTRLYLLNRWLEPAPVGAPGEICVGGVQVGRGYLNRPDLTAAAFRPDPFGPPGTRLYHTGDLGRYRADGVIEFLGRVDHQVKIRGHRIEPGEVEACLATHPGVQATAVVARLAAPGIYRLVAYVVGEVDADALRQHLRATLPDYMIPAAFVSLEALPLTPNGKVDRNALPEPDLGAQLAQRFVAPRTPTEEILAQIWADVLRVERVGINDNFFELGGDSILSIQIVSRARQAGLMLMPKQIFDLQSIAELAAAAETNGVAAEQGDVEGEAPLTPIQHWFFEQELAKADHWNLAVLLEIRAALRPADLERAVRQLIHHHDALRMRFQRRNDEWMAFNAASETQDVFHVEDFSQLAPDQQAEALTNAADRWQKTLHLETGPLLRVIWFNLGADRRPQLLIIIHHLVVDGVSLRILLEDLDTACRQLAGGETLALPAKTTSYRAWANRLWEAAQSGVPEEGARIGMN
ncbi:hypothetical protein CU048_08815 [Beijerinckiaceae bacterium]|nr:hypothetical protein CU048_08815 [Beijerinckiaceae bacterium]